MPSPVVGALGAQGSPNVQMSTPQGDAPVATTPSKSDLPSDTLVTVKTPDGEVKVVAEGLQDMVKRLEAMAAQKEKEKAKAAQQK